MRGARVLSLDGVADGTVVVDAAGPPRPLPLLRTLQVLALEDSAQRWNGFANSGRAWQGLALVGEVSADLRRDLMEATGVSRVAPAGELQDADATWDDGETEP